MKQTHQIGTINEKEKIREGGERGREAVKEWDGGKYTHHSHTNRMKNKKRERVSLEKNTSPVQIHYSFTDTNKFKEEKIKTVSLF